MLGTDKSRDYCLEMIRADFLAGANLVNGDPQLFLLMELSDNENRLLERRWGRQSLLRELNILRDGCHEV